MTENCNADALLAARAIVAANNCPAHKRAIMDGAWDQGSLVQDALREVLTQPELVAGGDE